jgi:KDO2-lipid IV(A) lauroyltransferase
MSNRLIYRWTAAGCSNLPLPVLLGISIVGNTLAIALMRHTLAAAAENFRIAFGWDERRARREARRLFYSYGRNVIDTFRIRGGAEVPPTTTHDDDGRILRRVLAGGRGCLIVTGHVGNWEMGAMSLRAHGLRSAVVGQPELDPDVQALRLEVRGRLGVETIDIGASMATAFRVREAVERGLAVAMVADRPYADDQVEVEFFGRRVPFLRSPARLARFCDCPLLPSFFLRNADGTYRSFLGDPLVSDRSVDADADSARMMGEVARVVERAIREDPAQWYNFYRYWATPPPKH